MKAAIPLVAILLPVLAVPLVLSGCRGTSVVVESSPAHARLAERYPLVPYPQTLIPGDGHFTIDGATVVLVSPGGDDGAAIAEMVASSFGGEGDYALAVEPIHPESRSSNVIALVLHEDETDSREAYVLTADKQSVVITASNERGLFYGVQTLLQLAVGQERDGVLTYEVPSVEIMDAPRFGYRGMHLDVGRHMFPVDFIKRYIELMARYKFNMFHWHLTEDQGWRIEILKYPELTRIGAYRSETILEKNFNPYVGDGVPYGGFYTQQEVREVVAFASSHHVTVIPEIEMPGHSLAALAAYPELACTPGPFEVRTVWGVADDIYCPSEATFEFLQNVLTEVMGLFPGPYIHVGGDEAPKRVWEESELAQAVIKREGLADEHELQSYFIRRIEKFLLEHGRRLIGWDEILEGGLAPQATVMSWRGTSGGIEAARQGHDVIMTPNSHLYFDHYQGDPKLEPLAIGGLSTLDEVYSYDPIPDELTADEAEHVLGAQANVWTEYIKTPEYVEYMVLPRMLALSEVVWSPREQRNYSFFADRLHAHFEWFDAQGLNYRLPSVRGLEGDRLTLSQLFTLRLETLPGLDIRYTADGRDPTLDDPVYERPVALDVDPSGTVVTARSFSRGGSAGPISRATIRRSTLIAPDLDGVSSSSIREALLPGVKYVLFQGQFASVHQLAGVGPSVGGTMASIELPTEYSSEFGALFEGFLLIPEDGIYEFALVSDDGSQLQIGGRVVVDNDGLHGATQRSGAAALAAGPHQFALLYFEAGGGKELRLLVRRPGGEATTREAWEEVPKSWYARSP